MRAVKKTHARARGVDHGGAGMIREDFSEEVTLKQAPEQREGVSHRNNGGKDSRQRHRITLR